MGSSLWKATLNEKQAKWTLSDAKRRQHEATNHCWPHAFDASQLEAREILESSNGRVEILTPPSSCNVRYVSTSSCATSFVPDS